MCWHWSTSSLCYQAINQVYLINWPVRVKALLCLVLEQYSENISTAYKKTLQFFSGQNMYYLLFYPPFFSPKLINCCGVNFWTLYYQEHYFLLLMMSTYTNSNHLHGRKYETQAWLYKAARYNPGIWIIRLKIMGWAGPGVNREHPLILPALNLMNF